MNYYYIIFTINLSKKGATKDSYKLVIVIIINMNKDVYKYLLK